MSGPVERYRLAGDGAMVVSVNEGDEVEIQDPEGAQICEVAAISPAGECLQSVMGSKADCAFPFPAPLLSDIERRTQRTFGNLSAVRLFGADSPAGSRSVWKVSAPAFLLCRAPGEFMSVSGESLPPTDLEIRVKRARMQGTHEPPLPAPLGRVRAEFRVNRATALSYEVEEGEYIQIIDVEGRQCSDFLAYDRAQLARGVERGLDATATRTVMARAYPLPGLHAKFLDADMRPLVEVIQDTVGRHDTFGLACTAKFYEDMGYPGHANCSDNFNSALTPYGLEARKGWTALNLFYNTGFDKNWVLFLDESWSRPGDYVLFKALRKLVCGSSACPDDIDAANGWNPTDIHVRIYEAKHHFPKGVAYRMTADSLPQMTKPTPFNERTSELTRNFTEYRGYWIPQNFGTPGVVDEYLACRERAVVMDLSALRKFEVVGPDAEALLQWTLTRDIRKLSVGQVVYTAMCQETGGMLDDGTVLKLGPQNFRWICGCDSTSIWLREQAQRKNFRVLIKNSTEQLCNLAVQGPRSREILKQIVWTPPLQPTIEALKWFRFTIGRIESADGPAILISRTGYTGELGYEVWCHPKDAVTVWDKIQGAGAPHGMLPLGMEALDILRIEAGLVFAGFEFDDTLSPYEAGIGFAVAADKPDFIGKAALQRHREHPNRVLVGLEIEGNEIVNHGDCVHVGRQQVGVITSSTRSPILMKNIALCRIAIEHATIGTRLEIGKLDGHQKRLPATVVPFPFYDPEKKRVRS